MGNQVQPQPEKPVREQIREQKRNIERSMRNIEREKKRLETEEKKMKAEIKKMATNNQHKAAKMLAKDIVRVNSQISKMTDFCGQLKALTLRISGISTLNELTNAMEEASSAITKVSSKLDAGKLAELSKNLAKEDAKLDMKQEMLTDVLDGIGESMDDPAEQERLYQQVLQDVGIQVEGLIPGANTGAVKKKEAEAEDDSIDQMLKNLAVNK